MSTVSPRPPPATSRKPSASPTPARSPPTVRATTGTARSPVVSTPVARRRPPSKASTPVPQLNGDTKESLSESLKQESAHKEQLLVQVQDKEATIATLATENDNLSSALNATETRLNELYAEQSRWEQEIAQRIEVADKLREQVREVEKEKRDLQRRYNEQTSSFEAERQAFYDNEQHLKSRIQSLTQARKRAEAKAAEATSPVEPSAEDTLDSAQPAALSERSISQRSTSQSTFNDPDNEPAEMTALKLELSTLSTSYTSIQSTLLLLQSQLVDLKRVNQELQEENESYMILLREKTLSGQFDLMRQVGGSNNSTNEDSEDDERGTNGDLNSLHSITRSTLDRVEEEPEHIPDSGFADLEEELSRASSRNSKPAPTKPGRRRTASTSAPRGESLADLPVAGPGLDLAAELGRAENKDILEGNYVEPQEDTNKSKRTKKGTHQEESAPSDVEALRSEVKNLKDANKALSLYASKIIDRIIAQEGFEHVLAADYDQPKTPSTANPSGAKAPPKASPAKPRPQSVLVARTTSTPAPPTPTLATPTASSRAANPKRRSLSFDWKTFSFSTDKKPEPSPNLRQLTLQPGSSPVVTSARKLETLEDEEDRKERERLSATMKLMGIQPQPSIHSPGIARTQQMEGRSESPNAPGTLNRRFSLWGKPPAESSNSDAQSTRSSLSNGAGLGLTHDVLEHVEAENSLAALDAREKSLSQEIANGGTGGFTEPQRRVGRRSRRSQGGSGSGSTVWSAGMNDD
ncbi:hypothetical protein D9611_003276 [Ephemerocybe angulata]|uniref:Uncharacterized protein n=1 Tax=Ephemerocybe angulata TaxID=980116 RepID=A0A8H5FH54_9AGAR|nr:hypothetical protein D9611_003276 [Tulosesus angulatus]